MSPETKPPSGRPRKPRKKTSRQAGTRPSQPSAHARKRTQGSGKTEAKSPVAFTPEQQQQLAALHKEHHASLVLVARLRGLRDADMMATDSLIEAFRRFDPKRGRFVTFLYKVLRSRIIDYWRGVIRRALLFAPLPAHFEAADDSTERARQAFLIRDALEAALRRLPREEQLLTTLHYLHGLSYDEIARLS